MAVDVRCELTELIESQCGHCRGDVEPRAVDPSPQGPKFTARYGGKCARCGDRFDAGDLIAPAQSGYLCESCT